MWGWLSGSTSASGSTATSTSQPEICSAAQAYWYLNINDDQKRTVSELRSCLTEKGIVVNGIDDDFSFLRFLKAREWDVQKAATMYEDMARWRAENAVDTILERESFPEQDALLEVLPMFYHKQDKFGRPIYIELLGRADASKLLQAMSIERLLTYHIYSWERYHRQYLPACSVASNKKIMTTCVIVDLAGLSLSNFNTSTQKIMNAYSKIDQDYYPEHLGLLFVINTPLIFRGIWAAVQPLLQERTRRKIIILGTDFLPTLKQVIDEENIPTIFGGKSEIPDLKISMGPWMESSEACAKATIELSPATSPASMQRSTDHSIPEELPVAARKLQEAVSDDLAAMGGIAASQAVTAVA